MFCDSDASRLTLEKKEKRQREKERENTELAQEYGLHYNVKNVPEVVYGQCRRYSRYRVLGPHSLSFQIHCQSFSCVLCGCEAW